MFENIIGHKSFIEQLEKEIKSNSFPSSVLISGPLYCGKQTIALEIARVLTCQEDADWNCKCRSCKQNRVLTNPQVLLMGWDLFLPEIFAVKNVLEKKKDITSCYLFLRGIRKLLRRFDSVFIEENDSKYKKISSLVNNIEEQITEFDPEFSVLSAANIDIKTALTIVDSCKSILKEYNFTGIPIDQIRKINNWIRFSDYSNKKIIIIENAENMNDKAQNALLKILEEPPDNTFFILLTCRPGEIIPTIKSRLRKYEIKERAMQDNKTVIEKIFKEEPGIFSTIKEYLDSAIPETTIIKKAAKQFMIDLYDNNEQRGLSPEIKNILKPQFSEYYPFFLTEILNLSGELLKNKDFNNNPENIIFVNKINKFVNESYKGFEKLNISQDLLTESMFLELRNR